MTQSTMKKSMAVIGSAAALSFSGAGLAAAQSDLPGLDSGSLGAAEATETDETDTDDAETPAEVSEIAAQLCGSISAYDFLGSVGSVVPGLTGDDCEANADLAIAAAMTGDISGALDILRGIDAGTPEETETDETVDSGSLDSLSADADETDDAETGA
ncbi:hypothetical protein [Dietzia sp. UBA5065]|jgi:hypothetical protein|uniref:hypothetical protein n=1 Tax=Dietzia sp. UBA5065 TaxID=1946422 RepID=UPI0025C2CDDF|nr:hypothetical protein [Dietzia sp. UBA5065]HMT48643.1 hypothetical protein [Dietzia sp.]